MIEWIRLEINIYFSRILCLIFFAFYETTFTKKSTKVFLDIEDLELRSKLSDNDKY